MPHVSLDFFGLVVQDLTHRPAQPALPAEERGEDDTWTHFLFITLLKGGFLCGDITTTFHRYDSSTSMKGHLLLQEKPTFEAFFAGKVSVASPNFAPISVALEKGGKKSNQAV